LRPSSTLWPLGISLAGLLLLVPITLSYAGARIPFQPQLTGGTFILICSVGAILGVYPSKVLALLGRGQVKAGGMDGHASTGNRGHHPPCGRFSTHIISVAGRALCAGCTGLVLGALISIAGSLVYFFIGLSPGDFYIIFWFGFALILLGLFQHRIDLDDPLIHAFLNVVFVLGAFLLEVGVDHINGSLLVQSYLLAVTVYWIMARIVLSEADHVSICGRCGQEGCPFSLAA
jgi:uncharacterized protein YsxB (DUF464 family)